MMIQFSIKDILSYFEVIDDKCFESVSFSFAFIAQVNFFLPILVDYSSGKKIWYAVGWHYFKKQML
jgi:hypothetical protein